MIKKHEEIYKYLIEKKLPFAIQQEKNADKRLFYFEISAGLISDDLREIVNKFENAYYSQGIVWIVGE